MHLVKWQILNLKGTAGHPEAMTQSTVAGRQNHAPHTSFSGCLHQIIGAQRVDTKRVVRGDVDPADMSNELHVSDSPAAVIRMGEITSDKSGFGLRRVRPFGRVTARKEGELVVPRQLINDDLGNMAA